MQSFPFATHVFQTLQARFLGWPLNAYVMHGEPEFDESDRLKFWSTTASSTVTTLFENKNAILDSVSSKRAPWSSLQLEDYEIDSMTGFVPCSPPVTQLPCAFVRWEQALASAPKTLSLADDDSPHSAEKRESSLQWRNAFVEAPVLDTTPLEDEPDLLRRAHHVLAFLVHFYVHSCPRSTSIQIPASLAVPLVKISKRLSIAPVLTFADTVLWNHEIIDPSRPLTRSNIRPLTLFTGLPDEANFYGCCAEIELRGVEALGAIAHFYDIFLKQDDIHDDNHNQHDGSPPKRMEIDDSILDHAEQCLNTVAGVIRDLTTILQSVRQICDPHAFYFAIRPWFRGSDAAGPEAASSQRWIYQGVDENDILELSGPSAGQSSIIHTLDIFLDIDHSNSPETTVLAPFVSAHTKQTSAPQIGPIPASTLKQTMNLPNGQFMNRMRRYMPGSHQAFLEQLTQHTHEQAGRNSIRNLVIHHPERLMDPYNQAVLALKQFRDAHIRIACLYIVSMSRTGHSLPLSGDAKTGMGSMCPAMRKRQSEPVRGTGGNELSILLKSCRDATSRTLLHIRDS